MNHIRRFFSPFEPILIPENAMASADGTAAAGTPPADALPSRSVLVLYGSETGNSQEIAEDLDRIAQRMRFESRVAEMNSVQLVCRSPFQPESLTPEGKY